MKKRLLLLPAAMVLLGGSGVAWAGLENIQNFNTAIETNVDVVIVNVTDADSVLVVGVGVDNSASAVTNMTYNGVEPDGLFGNERAFFAYFINPSTGANDLVVMRNSTITSGRNIQAAEVTGVDLGNAFNASVNGIDSAATLVTVSNSGEGATGIFIVDFAYNNGDGSTAAPAIGSAVEVDSYYDGIFSMESVLGSGYVSKDGGSNKVGFTFSSGYQYREIAVAFNYSADVSPLAVLGAIPTGSISDSTPLIEAYFRDVIETVDTNSIALTIDGGSPVSGVASSYSSGITTVSYTPAVPLTLDTSHTVSVVVASTPSGTLYTNEFSFYLGFPIRYVAVTTNNTVMAASANGPVGDGTAWITTTANATDGMWRFRNEFGIPVTVTNEPTVGNYQAYSGQGNVYESDNDDCPRVKTTAYVDAPATYNVYVYYNGNEAWDIRAGLEDTAGTNSLALYNAGNGTLLFSYDGGFFNHQFYRAKLGTVTIADTNTPITVYMEDAPTVGGRTWVEGIGIQPLAISVPTQDPDIQSFSVAGGIATFTWSSEVIGTYSIMHKTNLTDSWTPVKTGIGGGAPTTTDSVSVSGAAQEFFRIEGE